MNLLHQAPAIILQSSHNRLRVDRSGAPDGGVVAIWTQVCCLSQRTQSTTMQHRKKKPCYGSGATPQEEVGGLPLKRLIVGRDESVCHHGVCGVHVCVRKDSPPPRSSPLTSWSAVEGLGKPVSLTY